MRIETSAASLSPVPAAEVEAFERAHRCTFPAGYQAFVTRFGQGVLTAEFSDGGEMEFVRVYGPRRIEGDLAEFRSRWAQFWFWTDPGGRLDQSDFRDAICFVDTLDGDEVVLLPGHGSRVVGLPRDMEEMTAVEPNLDAVLTYFTTLVYDLPPIVRWVFSPF